MNQTTGAARAKSDALASLAARLPDPQDREWFAELVSYLQSLSPDDELVKVAQLFGFLTLMGHELPAVITAEQNKMREFLQEEYKKLQQEVKTNASYHEQLQKRLSKLPDEISAGVKPEAIAKAMSESFRQQILKIGLQETQTLLSAAADGLKKTTKALDEAVEPITTRYNDLARNVEKQASRLDSEGNQLARTADTIQRKNAELVAEIRNLNWIWVVTASVAILLVGVFSGITWEQRNVGDLVVDLQTQVAQLQHALKITATSSTESNSQHVKKK